MEFSHNSSWLSLTTKLKPPQKILVIITRRIGDVLLTTPLIHTLKAAWPQASIDVLVSANTQDILANNPNIRKVIIAPDKDSKLANLKWLLCMWNKYDLAISALPSDRAIFSAWVAGKYRIGLLENKPNQGWKRYLLNNWVAFDNINTHTVNMNLKLAEQLGLALHYKVSAYWTETDCQLVNSLLQTNLNTANPTYAVLHIYPKFSYKMWHSAGWIKLVEWLNSQNIPVILTGANTIDEMAYIKALHEKLPSNSINLAGKFNFAQMAYLLKNAAIYIGPDTVTSHLAAAMGTPTIALFGPSNPVKWGPWPANHYSKNSPWKMLGAVQKMDNVLLIQGQQPQNMPACIPCHLEGCERHINSHSQCLNELPADRIIAAIKTFIN